MIRKTILLVEDNVKVMRNNLTVLKSRGVTVLSADTIAKSRLILADNKPDAAALDIMLPDGSGLDLLREIRASSSLPILLLTALGESQDVVTGLSLGADDYLAKPYSINVFAARIDALLRRAGTVNESVAVGLLRFDLLSNQAYHDGRDLLLTQKEFALLLLLAQNERKTLSSEYLFEKVWGQQLKGDTAPLRLQMSNLKKKLAAKTKNALIEASRGEGYSLTLF